MSLITLVRHTLRKWAMHRIEQDIDWARASSDAHIAGLERRLERLRAEHDRRSTQDVARDVSRTAKAL